MKDEQGSHSWQNLLRAFAIEWLLLCALAVLVSLVMTALRQVEVVRSLDRSVSDGIMRDLAKARLAEDQSGKSARYIFVSVGEETCRIWSEARQEVCAAGFMTPRDKLIEMLKALASANSGPDRTAMKLIALDVELAPQAVTSDFDSKLCEEAYAVAASIPVLAVRPMVTDVSDPALPVARAYPSIFDECKSASQSAQLNLWFASPLLQPDPDNVVRSIYAWHMVRQIAPKTSDISSKTGDIPPTTGDSPPKTGDSPLATAERISGFGLLGAALAGGVDRSVLACLFPASRPDPDASCGAKSFELAKHVYDPSAMDQKDASAVNSDGRKAKDGWSILRILFSLPSDAGTSAAKGYSYAPFVFQTIEAYKLQQRLIETPQLLDGAIVIIGGSYVASGDLHATPLALRMPGAMVHANAIRAIAAGSFVEEHEGWGWEFLLIGIASLIGAVFHVAGHQTHERLRSPFNHIAKLGLAVLSIVVTVLAVFVLGVVHAFSSLAAGTAIAVMSPIIAVAFEGMSSILQVVREALSAALAWAQRFGNRSYVPPKEATSAVDHEGHGLG